MSTPPVERKLAAIFAADIAGYSRLMAHDEVGTLPRPKAYRLIIDGPIATHRGRIFNTAGDSVVADFASAVGAVACAVAVQRDHDARTQRCPGRWFTDAGGLMSYRVSWPDLNRRGGADITQILKGANPGDIPFYQASRFEFVIQHEKRPRNSA